uniref:Dynactin subunit 2 n=1 Tax=Hyaloperonospora arabidopsidis (strain Emoy2) TaxID=559515 RepID=M4BM64_HYAAE
MDYSIGKEGIKRRKIMSTEVFETPNSEEVFKPYAPANASARQSRAGLSAGAEAEGHFYDKRSMELDEQEVPATQAFEVFMGKVYKPAAPQQTEYELLAGTSSSNKTTLESPLSRFTRLSLELKELETDLTLLAVDAEHKKHNVMLDASQEAEFTEVMQGLNTLQLNLSALGKNAAFQPFLRAGTTAASADAAMSLQKDLTAKFFQKIDSIKKQQQLQPAELAFSEDAPIVYEIYNNCELDAMDQDAKSRVAALEARISMLEKIVGGFQGQEMRSHGLDSISGVSNVDLSSAVAQLELRVALMSEKNLDAVKTRTAALLHEFTLLSKLKQSPSVQKALNSQADDKQIQKLYGQLSSLDTIAALVPTVVDRLVALKSVHDELLTVSARVDKMEKTQASLDELLDSDAAILANLIMCRFFSPTSSN